MWACNPYRGETQLNYSGPTPPYQHLDTSASYSWLKSPRWKGHAMETGPLARILMMYANGHEPTKQLADQALGQLGLPLDAMFSTMGRTAARTLEAKILADSMPQWYDALMANIRAGDVRTFNEAPVGAFELAAACAGRGIPGGAARLVGALDHHRRWQDCELSGRGADHVECRSARRAGRGGTV